MVKTVVELDLAGYSDVARELEDHLSVAVVMSFNDQIQTFVDDGLKQVGVLRQDAVMAQPGDGAILVFDHPETAHKFATAVHNSCRTHNDARSTPSAKRWFRVGIATGELVMEGGSDTVKVATALVTLPA